MNTVVIIVHLVIVQEVGVSKPTLWDLLPFKITHMLIAFCKSLPERYQAVMEYWRERRKEKIEEEEEEEEDDDELEGDLMVLFSVLLVF